MAERSFRRTEARSSGGRAIRRPRPTRPTTRAPARQRLVRPSRVELWIADADGGNPRQITRLGGANFAPFFHPDGNRIIFSSNYENPRSGNFDLYLINVDGTGLTQDHHPR